MGKNETIEHLAVGHRSLFYPDEYEDHPQDLKRVEKTTVTKMVCHSKGTPHSHNQVRKEFLDRLPQKDQVIDLTNHRCPHYQREMTKVGQKVVSRQVQVMEPQLYCENKIQITCKCPYCSQDGKVILVSSNVPIAILPHSFFSSSILAKQADYKFNLVLPFHRQELIWQSMGLPINSKQMALNIIKVSQTYLEPLYEQLSAVLLSEHVLHMDETPFRVIDAPRLQSWFWDIRITEKCLEV